MISSSGDEDAFRVAPSQRTAEEEEQSGSRGGRCEPRSKLLHDRDAEAARGAPCEEAGAPEEEARTNSPHPPKAKKRVWRMADE